MPEPQKSSEPGTLGSARFEPLAVEVADAPQDTPKDVEEASASARGAGVWSGVNSLSSQTSHRVTTSWSPPCRGGGDAEPNLVWGVPFRRSNA